MSSRQFTISLGAWKEVNGIFAAETEELDIGMGRVYSESDLDHLCNKTYSIYSTHKRLTVIPVEFYSLRDWSSKTGVWNYPLGWTDYRTIVTINEFTVTTRNPIPTFYGESMRRSQIKSLILTKTLLVNIRQDKILYI